jgi:hypothetical protein
MNFDPTNYFLNIQDFIGNPTLKVGVHLGAPFEGALSLEPKNFRQQIEGQKKSFSERNFSPCRERNKWKPRETNKLKLRKFPRLPLLHMQFTRA